MSKVIEIQTSRLLLRQWKQADYPHLAKLNADPIVMEYYPNTLTEAESSAMADKLHSLLLERSWGFWAVEIIETKQFIGFVGLHKPTYDLPVTPCIEVGWRLAKEYWGKGYATEAARAALKFAFEELHLSDVYSFTSVSNKKSWAVMERLGLQNTHTNFEHPIIPEGNSLREHVLYKITMEQFRTKYPSTQ